MPFNRVQNPVLQDRLHDLLGIKGMGSAAPTLGGEIHPVVIVGDTRDVPRSRQQRWVMGTHSSSATAGNLFCYVALINPVGSGMMIRLRRAWVQQLQSVAGFNMACCAFTDNAAGTAGIAREEHRSSPEVVVGRMTAFQQAGSIANAFARISDDLPGAGFCKGNFIFEDLVIQSGQAISFGNETSVGFVAGNTIAVTLEWREDEIR